jgi:Methylase involved in ubiquinone/menaquinone biosynthesis
MNERLEQEKNYHNEIFGEDNPRDEVIGFYSIDRQKTDFINELINKYSKNASVLEYGCGVNCSAFSMAELSDNVAGIDISDVAVKKNNEQAAQIGIQDRLKFYVMDAHHLEFSDNCFDFVYGNSILHHLDIEKAYRQISRVLNCEGHAVFCEPLKYNPFIGLFRVLTPRLRTKDEHPLSSKDLRDAHKYFAKVEISYFSLFTLFAIPFKSKKAFKKILNFFEHLDKSVFRHLPFLRKFSWMVVMDLSDPIKEREKE